MGLQIKIELLNLVLRIFKSNEFKYRILKVYLLNLLDHL